MSQKRWTIAFAPAGEGLYDVTVRRSGSVHRFKTRLPPDISDLWQPAAAGTTTTRSFRSDAATLSPEARFFQAANLPTLKDIGERVLGSVFDTASQGGEGTKIVGALEDRIADNEGLEIEVDLSQTAELSGIPWEALYLRSHDRFLAIGTTSNIVRKLDAQSELPPPATRPMRILVVTANPTDNLDTSAELGNIQRRVDELVAKGSNDFEVAVLTDATRDDFRRKIVDWKPHAIHYIGHSAFAGDSGYLFLESDAPGKSDKVSAETLRNMLLNNRPWLVVLNSCQSGQTSASAPMAGVAQNLLQRLNIPFVVAMQQPVSDDAAIAFSQDFYTALTSGESIASAVTLGRCAIANQADVRTQVELITPALYTSGDADRIAFADKPDAPAVVAAPVADAPDAPKQTSNGLLAGTNAKLAAVLLLLTTLGGILTQIDSIGKTLGGWFGADEKVATRTTPIPSPTRKPESLDRPPTPPSPAPVVAAARPVSAPPALAEPQLQANAPRARAAAPRRAVVQTGGNAANTVPPVVPVPAPASEPAPSGQQFATAVLPPELSSNPAVPRRMVRRSATITPPAPFERPGAAAPATELGAGGGLGEAAATTTYQPDQDPAAIYAMPSEFRAPAICDGLALTVRFASGSGALSDADTARLEALAPRLACPDSNLVVAGFTDTKGSAERNLDLSLERAEATLSAIAEPIAAHVMVRYGNAYAEAYPVVATADGVDEAQNRRAEVYLGHRCAEPDMVVQTLRGEESLQGLAARKPYPGTAEAPAPVSITLHRRDLGGTVEDADAARLDALSREVAAQLGAPPAAIFPMLVGGSCLAPGEDERITIVY